MSWQTQEALRAASDPERSFARPGGALYGVDLSEFEAGTERPAHDLRPVLGVACRVTQVREIPAGARVGYGGTWTAPRPSRIGLLPVGYSATANDLCAGPLVPTITVYSNEAEGQGAPVTILRPSQASSCAHGRRAGAPASAGVPWDQRRACTFPSSAPIRIRRYSI